MTRKHFYGVANILAAQWAISNPEQRGTVWQITLSMADKFGTFNHLFDRARFYKHIFGTADPYEARNECDFERKECKCKPIF